MLHGVDVSSYQPNWVPAADDSFVYSSKQLKAPVTATATQPLSWPAARAKRLKVGNYHFLRPDNAKKQAAYFVGDADIHPGDLLVCYWENTSDGHPSIADAAIFIAEVKKRKPHE